jgi:FkbM family methyltransferase
MNDILKDSLRRLFQRLGIRLQKYPFYKYPQDRNNYPELKGEDDTIIFDIGGNIGQTSNWFRLEFPQSRIIAFEPFAIIFAELRRNTAASGVECHHMGFSNEQGTAKVPRGTNPLEQTGSIHNHAGVDEDFEEIQVGTVDGFCKENEIGRISILKTDTEGHDMMVLRGAEAMLSEGRIDNILTEATIDPGDSDHTNLFEIRDYLAGMGYELYSLYDLNQNHVTGKLQYFNALFKLKDRA